MRMAAFDVRFVASPTRVPRAGSKRKKKYRYWMKLKKIFQNGKNPTRSAASAVNCIVLKRGTYMNSAHRLASRREFLKSFPRFFLSEFRSVTGAVLKNSTSEKNEPKTAQIDVNRCLAWSGSDCQLCYVACPKRDQAILMRDLKPMIVPLVCDGCSMCETACRSVNDTPAVRMVWTSEA